MHTRGRAGRWAGLLLVLTRCGEAEMEVAEFAELCGVAGPVRVLEHAEDHAVIYRHRRVGERLFFDIGPVGPTSSAGFYALDKDSQIWTTGLCGESPTRLDEQFKALFLVAKWPDVALVCDGYGNLLSLAESGPLAPHVVFPDFGCRPIWTSKGAISPDYGNKLMFFPYPEDWRVDRVEPIELPGEVMVFGVDPAVVVTATGVLVLRPDHELVHIDLPDLTVTSVQAGVGDFVASPSGRYVLWRGVSASGDDAEVGPQAVVFIDRETGLGLGVDETYLTHFDWEALRWGDMGYMVLPSVDGERRIYHLPDLKFVALPRGHEIAWEAVGAPLDPLTDGRWMVTDTTFFRLKFLDLDTGALTPIFTGRGDILARTAEGTVVRDAGADGEGAVWLVPDDGSKARRLARRATFYAWLAGEDSLISPVDLDAQRRGRLVRVDADTGAEQLVDDRVYPIEGMGDRREPDIVRYSVQDGARSGVWQVRLPTR